MSGIERDKSGVVQQQVAIITAVNITATTAYVIVYSACIEPQERVKMSNDKM